MKNKTTKQPKPLYKLEYIPLDDILEPELPVRTAINKKALTELEQSIKAVGLLEPIGLTPNNNKFEIIWGHRRYLACKRLNKTTIPALVTAMATQKMLISRVHENLNREEVPPYDEALYLKLLQEQFNYTNKRLATVLGRSESYISQRLAIFNWPTQLQKALQQNEINFSVARILSRIDDQLTLNTYLNSAIKQGTTPALVKHWVDLYFQYKNKPQHEQDPADYPIDEATHIHPTGTCYFCDAQLTYNKLKNVNLCSQCIQLAISLFIQEHDKQKKQTG